MKRRIAGGVVAVVLVLLLAAGAVAAHRLTEPLPAPSVQLDVAASFQPFPGSPPKIPLPATGSLAIASATDGVLAEVRSHVVRPIGSVAKTMTALLVLRSHPLVDAAASGPVLTMTPGDALLYRQAVAEQGSAFPVSAGERLSERQLLLALMLPSANNIAETLAGWVGRSRAAFITSLNDAARSLGMHGTHFDDPSGYSPRTVSTAADLVLLAREALRFPALAAIVATQRAALPGGVTVANLDGLLVTQPGWIGIKTGWTPQAGGCLLFAARQTLAPGAAQTVFGAVLGEPPLARADPEHPELGGAFGAAAAAVSAALGGYAALSASDVQPFVNGTVRGAWGERSSIKLEPQGGPVLLRQGTRLRLSRRLTTPQGPELPGAQVGLLEASGAGRTLTWKLVLASPLAPPAWTWRLRYG